MTINKKDLLNKLQKRKQEQDTWYNLLRVLKTSSNTAQFFLDLWHYTQEKKSNQINVTEYIQFSKPSWDRVYVYNLFNRLNGAVLFKTIKKDGKTLYKITDTINDETLLEQAIATTNLDSKATKEEKIETKK